VFNIEHGRQVIFDFASIQLLVCFPRSAVAVASKTFKPELSRLSPKDEASFRLMRLIEQNPNSTQRELAEAAGISLGKTHYVIGALVDRGFVKLERFGSSRNKLAYAYVLTPSGLARKAAIAGCFLDRKRKEYDALRDEIEQLASEIEVGRRAEHRR
jgi:EPS-associated MarR family transcriptional regulator